MLTTKNSPKWNMHTIQASSLPPDSWLAVKTKPHMKERQRNESHEVKHRAIKTVTDIPTCMSIHGIKEATWHRDALTQSWKNISLRLAIPYKRDTTKNEVVLDIFEWPGNDWLSGNERQVSHIVVKATIADTITALPQPHVHWKTRLLPRETSILD